MGPMANRNPDTGWRPMAELTRRNPGQQVHDQLNDRIIDWEPDYMARTGSGTAIVTLATALSSGTVCCSTAGGRPLGARLENSSA